MLKGKMIVADMRSEQAKKQAEVAKETVLKLLENPKTSYIFIATDGIDQNTTAICSAANGNDIPLLGVMLEELNDKLKVAYNKGCDLKKEEKGGSDILPKEQGN